MTWELFETEGRDRLRSGWSLDAVATTARAGLGIARDIYEGRNLEIDLGGYVTQEYRGLLEGKLEPQLGVGLSIRF
jgi:hypothetical protein